MMEDSLLRDSLMEGSPLECSICLERMKDVSYLTTQPDENGNTCTHYFCTKCIQPLVKIAKSRGKEPCCPSCRRAILAVTKSRVCDELIKEATVEREQRKLLQLQVGGLEKELEECRKKCGGLEVSQGKFKEKAERNGIELAKAKEDSKRALLEVESLKRRLEEEASAARQATDKLQQLQLKLDIAESSLGEEKRSSLAAHKELEDAKKEASSKNTEVERWKKMYQHAVDDLQRKSKADLAKKAPPTTTEKASESLSSWLSPISAVSSFSYLFGSKSGPLVRPTADFKFLERRGSSLQSVVWKAMSKHPSRKSFDRPVALKKLKTNTSKEETWREAMLLGKLEHTNILKLQGVIRDAHVPGADITGDFLILPFVELDLEYVMSHRSTQLKESQSRYILYQAVSALYYLHSAEVVHRDITPTAILLDDNCNIKIGSFSSARSLHSQPFFPLPITSQSAPENAYMQDTRPADWWKAGDMWSIGCVFFQMLAGFPLFEARDKNSLLSQIFSITECKPSNSDFMRFPILNTIEGCLSLPLSTKLHVANVPPAAQELLEGMLSFDPARRPSASDVLQHKYFQGAPYFVTVHRTCPLANDATDENIGQFVADSCGGL